mgnify:FL=1
MSFSLYTRPRSPYFWAKIPMLDRMGKITGYKRVSTKRTKKSEARRVAAGLEKTLADQGQFPDRQKSTIAEAGATYVAELASQGKPSVKDYRTYLSRVDNISHRFTGESDVSLLDRQFMLDLRRKRISEGYASRTINNELAFWRQVYNKSHTDYGLAITPSVDFSKLKMPTTQKTRYLLEGEEDRLLLELSPDRYETTNVETKRKLQDQYDLVVLLMDTGARLSEITSMAWSAVDYVNWKWLSVYRSKVKNESKLLLTDRAREILERRWSRNGNCEYIFQAYGSGKGPRGTSTKGIRNAIERAGLNTDALVDRYGPFTVHSLRHSFASKLVQGSMSIYGVSKLLGHSDVKTTQRYAHLAVDDVSAEAIKILESR